LFTIGVALGIEVIPYTGKQLKADVDKGVKVGYYAVYPYTVFGSYRALAFLLLLYAGVVDIRFFCIGESNGCSQPFAGVL